MDSQVILAYTAAGLGHLRVTNALFEAAPKSISPRLLRAPHSVATGMHRFSSIHPLTRALMEWSQNGLPEEFFTRVYRFVLRRGGSEVERELRALLEQEFTIVKKVVVVATHFGLAHEIASGKARLMKDLGISIQLVVVVTDDSPQKLWYVPGADLIFVPSSKTKERLHSYARRAGLAPVRIEVLPYPLSIKLTSRLTDAEFDDRMSQLSPTSTSKIQVVVPISGAAVNLEFTEQLMHSLAAADHRFHFYVVCRENLYTKSFLSSLERKAHVSLITSPHDREAVTYYNDLLTSSVFAFELTKPSEQAFKALLSPRLRGGVTLLFSDPVGRQEYDNLNFLSRHQLLDTRAFRLPNDVYQATSFILDQLQSNAFYSVARRRYTDETLETTDNGASLFWKKLTKLL